MHSKLGQIAKKSNNWLQILSHTAKYSKIPTWVILT